MIARNGWEVNVLRPLKNFKITQRKFKTLYIYYEIINEIFFSYFVTEEIFFIGHWNIECINLIAGSCFSQQNKNFLSYTMDISHNLWLQYPPCSHKLWLKYLPCSHNLWLQHPPCCFTSLCFVGTIQSIVLSAKLGFKRKRKKKKSSFQ